MKPQHGFIILEPYASSIIRGTKIREYRSYDVPEQYKNIPLFLLSGGRIFGIIKFPKTEKYNEVDWCWDIEVIESWLDKPKYKHPNGAQRWVRNVNKLQIKLDRYDQDIRLGT